MHRALSSVSAAIGVGLEAILWTPLTLPMKRIGQGEFRGSRQPIGVASGESQCPAAV